MDTTLVIMAAGLGSRYSGGIKQLARVGVSGEILMDVLPKNFVWKRFITKLEIKMIKEELN